MTFAKENYDLIGLLVGIVGVVIAVISLMDELKKRKTKTNRSSAFSNWFSKMKDGLILRFR